MDSVFITGTDTGCGKTRISCALLRALVAEGTMAVGMKPVATGASLLNGILVNEDVEALRAASPVEVPLRDMNPYLFEPPCAPHIAAQAAATKIDMARIESAFSACKRKSDVVVVEGVGGWCVPLGDDLWLSDLAAVLGLPVLLVVGVKLGCINHAVLTASAIRQTDRPLVGWIANVIEPELLATEEIIACLTANIPAPRLAVVDWTPQDSHINVAGCLDRLPKEHQFGVLSRR